MKKEHYTKEEISQLIYQSLVNNEHESIYFKDLDSKFIVLSQYHLNYFNLNSQDEAIGKTDFDFFTHPHAQEAYQDEQQIIKTGQPLLGKVELETWENDLVSYVVTSKYPLKDSAGNVIGTWGHSINLATAQHIEKPLKQKLLKPQEIVKHLQEAKDIDTITQLPNVKAFYEYMNLFYQDAMNTLNMPTHEHVLVLMDLKGMSAIIKEHGQLIADKYLHFLALHLTTQLSERDYAFRYGQDAFAILLKSPDIDAAITFVRQLLESFKANPFTDHELVLTPEYNLGLSRFRERLPFGTIYDIINLSDSRLYRAKSQEITYIFDDTY